MSVINESASDASECWFGYDDLSSWIDSLLFGQCRSGFSVHEDHEGLDLRVDKPRSAQDACPLFYQLSDQVFYLAVADGLGGSGLSEIDVDGKIFNHAFLASRAAISTLKHEAIPWIERNLKQQNGMADDLESSLGEVFYRQLSRLMNAFDERGYSIEGLIGGIIKNLPTTLSFARIEKHDNGQYRIDTFNCGDSRIYLLEPPERGGAALLTSDDAETGEKEWDALDAIYEDMPMTKVLSADQPVSMTHHQFDVPGKSIIAACSDGFHHYFSSPSGFEHRILEAIKETEKVSSSYHRLTGMSQHLFSACFNNLHDDTTLVLRCLDFQEKQLLDIFRPSEISKRLDVLTPSLAGQQQAKEYWVKQKTTFNRYLDAGKTAKNQGNPANEKNIEQVPVP